MSSDAAVPAGPARRDRRRAAAALAGLIAFHTVNNLVWLAADHHVHRVDEGYHVRKAVDMSLVLAGPLHDSLSERAGAFLDFWSPYPPLAHVVGGLFAVALGYTPDRVAFSCTVAFAVIVLGVYAVGRTWMPRASALFAAFVASFIPLAYGLSRLFSQDYFAAAIVVWAVYALIRSQRFRHSGWVLAFAVLSGLGMLAKPTAFAYLLLPAVLAVAAGAAGAFEGRRVHLGRLRRIGLNAVIAVAVAAGVSSWWYLHHFDNLYAWWTTTHFHGKGPMSRGMKELAETLRAEAPEAQAPAAAPAQSAAEAPAQEPSLFAVLTGPFRRHGHVYLIYLVNDALFLPTALIALAGLAALFVRARSALAPWLVVAWFVGTYLLLTWLFASRTPRYLVPMVPAAGLFCAAFFDALRPGWPRRLLQGAFAALLLFQYANLTYAAMGRLELPLLRDNHYVRWCANDGITVFKDQVVTGVYVIRPPHRGENSAQRIMDGFAAYERGVSGAGGVSQYRVVSRYHGYPGLSMIERDYGPADSPYRPADGSDRYDSPSRFEAQPEVRTPEEAAADIADTQFVVLKPGADADADRRAMFWASHIEPFGFEPLDLFYEEAFGKYHAGLVLTMARRPALALDTAGGLFDLLELRGYPPGAPHAVPPPLRGQLDQRLRAALEPLGPPMPLSPELDLVTFQVEQPVPRWFRLRMAFAVRGVPPGEFLVSVIGRVRPEHAAQLPERFQGAGQMEWNTAPNPSTAHWRPGEMTVVQRFFMAPPIPVQFVLQLADADGAPYGKPVATGWVDLGAMAGAAAGGPA